MGLHLRPPPEAILHVHTPTPPGGSSAPPLRLAAGLGHSGTSIPDWGHCECLPHPRTPPQSSALQRGTLAPGGVSALRGRSWKASPAPTPPPAAASAVCRAGPTPPRGAHRQHPATPYRCSDPDDKHEGQWEGGFTLHIALSPLPGLPSWCGWGHGGVQSRDCPPPSLSFLEVPAFLIKQRLPLLRKGPQNPALPHGKRGKGHGDPPKALRDPIPTRSPRPGGVGGFSGAGSGARRGSERHRQEAPLGQRRGAMERARTGRC